MALLNLHFGVVGFPFDIVMILLTSNKSGFLVRGSKLFVKIWLEYSGIY